MIGKKFRIKGKSKYFKRKYRAYNPIIWIPRPDKFELVEKMHESDSYLKRAVKEKLPSTGKIFSGKIHKIWEELHETELEEVEDLTGFCVECGKEFEAHHFEDNICRKCANRIYGNM